MLIVGSMPLDWSELIVLFSFSFSLVFEAFVYVRFVYNTLADFNRLFGFESAFANQIWHQIMDWPCLFVCWLQMSKFRIVENVAGLNVGFSSIFS